jgi:hypothetical protein
MKEESKYRFKTEKEFKEDSNWNFSENCPLEWATDMNKYLGKPIHYRFNDRIDKREVFSIDGWSFTSCECELIDRSEYFDSLSNHIGRKIIALKDAPYGGKVKKGEALTIVGAAHAIMENGKSYACNLALSLGERGVSFELIEERTSKELYDDIFNIIKATNK